MIGESYDTVIRTSKSGEWASFATVIEITNPLWLESFYNIVGKSQLLSGAAVALLSHVIKSATRNCKLKK